MQHVNILNLFMKKLIGLLSVVVVLAAMSCSDKAPEVKKEVIIVPVAPTVIVKDPPAKGTTIVLDKNGVKVETKKVKVDIKKQ